MATSYRNPKRKADDRSLENYDIQEILPNSKIPKKRLRIFVALGVCIILCVISVGLLCLMHTDYLESSLIRVKCQVPEEDRKSELELFNKRQESLIPRVNFLGECFFVPKEMRFDCHPNASRELCWTPLLNYEEEYRRKSKRVPLNVLDCYYPDRWELNEYNRKNNSMVDLKEDLKNIGISVYNSTIPVITMEASGRGKNILGFQNQDLVKLKNFVLPPSEETAEDFYKFLPYFYSLLFTAYFYGQPVMRPLFYSYTYDKNTLDIDSQFMWGESLMSVPILAKNATLIKVYLPCGIWYDYHKYITIESSGEWFTTYSHIYTGPLLLRAGSIIPILVPYSTTFNTRRNVFELIITLSTSDTVDSWGDWYWKDNSDNWKFNENKRCFYMSFVVSNRNKLTNEIHDFCKPELLKHPIILRKIEVRGVRKNVTEVIVNGKFRSKFFYNENLNLLYIYYSNYLNGTFEITWR